MAQAHDTAQHTSSRHLAAVPDENTDPMSGVTWQAQDEPAQDGPALAPARVYPAGAGRAEAARPARIDLGWVNQRLRAALAAGSTYALLAWARRWEVSMNYVMDPALRTELGDAAERDLDTKRSRAAKRLKRALNPEDKDTAQREYDRINRRIVSELEVDARVMAARSGRLLRSLAVPGLVVAGPVALAAAGTWVGLAAWPVAWAWLAVRGRAHARAELGTTTATAAEAAPGREVGPTPAPGRAGEVVGATEAENAILGRLSGAYWSEHAPGRGLDAITPGSPVLDAAGIAVVLHTSGKLTPAGLAKRANAVRALLGVATATRVEIAPGDTGERALLRIRTRARAADLSWRPGRQGIGLDEDTGEAVPVDPYRRLLVAGESGAGKSVALRPLLATVVGDEDAALVYIDAKRVEAALWSKRARVARTAEEITAVAEEVRTELMERLEELEDTGRASWRPTPQRPRLVVVVDEGAEVKSRAKDAIEDLRSLAMMGRAGEVHLWWCTQKPTMSGPAAGIDPQVAAQAGTQICLKVRSGSETRTVLGEDATGQGWDAHLLPAPGVCLIRGTGRGPAPVRVWHMSDEQVKTLPERAPWHRAGAEDPTGDESGGEDWIGAQHAVMAALREKGEASTAELAQTTGYSTSAVKKALGELRSKITKGPGHRDPWRLL